jgi:hypothetical protein
VAKDLVCIPCHRKAKGKEQIEKANERDKARRGGKAKAVAERTGRALRVLAVTEPDVRGDKVKMAQMDLYWKSAANELRQNPYCQECGAWIPEKIKQIGKKFTLNGYRCATAHLLPKKEEYGFPSVAHVLDNRIFLGAGCGCHAKYDRSWEDAASMKIWPIALEKIKKLIPLIDPKERKNIPDVILQELEPHT